jgi:hypothetical protein
MQWQMHSHHICTTSRIPYLDSHALVKEQCLDLVSEYMPPTCNGGFEIPILQYARAASKSHGGYHSANPHAQIQPKTAGHSEEDFATKPQALSMQIRQAIQVQTVVFTMPQALTYFGHTQSHPLSNIHLTRQQDKTKLHLSSSSRPLGPMTFASKHEILQSKCYLSDNARHLS